MRKVSPIGLAHQTTVDELRLSIASDRKIRGQFNFIGMCSRGEGETGFSQLLFWEKQMQAGHKVEE